MSPTDPPTQSCWCSDQKYYSAFYSPRIFSRSISACTPGIPRRHMQPDRYSTLTPVPIVAVPPSAATKSWCLATYKPPEITLKSRPFSPWRPYWYPPLCLLNKSYQQTTHSAQTRPRTCKNVRVFARHGRPSQRHLVIKIGALRLFSAKVWRYHCVIRINRHRIGYFQPKWKWWKPRPQPRTQYYPLSSFDAIMYWGNCSGHEHY